MGLTRVRGLLAAAVCFLLGGCPLATLDDYSIDTGIKSVIIVSDYNLQAYVPVPTAGAFPVKEIANREDMVVRAAWKDAEGFPLPDSFQTFVQGEVYQADLTFTAKEGFSFDPLIRFSYPLNAVEAQSTDNSTGERVLSVVYKTTEAPIPIDGEQDLTAHVPAPAMGGSPVTSFYAGTYGGMVVWEGPNRATAPGLFQAGTVYTAKITLYPAPGYTLAGASFTYTGSGELNPSGEWNNTGSALTGMTVAFPATTTVAAVAVNDLDLTYKLPTPVRGGTPVTYFSTPQYTGRVDWLVGGTGAPHNVFQANMAYTAALTLTAASGYTFGNPAVNFTHSGAAATTADNGNGTLSVTAVFPATTAIPAVAVNDPDLTFRLPKPVNGGTAVTYFSAPQYTGNVVWSSSGATLGGLFEANTAYTATITLTAASGYTFTGAVGAFTHGGAELITHLNGNTVRVRFPATTSEMARAVSDLNLTDKVSAPVRGGTPVSYFSSPEYTGSTAWSVSSGGQALGGLFEAGTTYTATVTVTAVSGFTLSGVGANAFSHSGASKVSNNAGSAVVVITFPATSGTALTLVGDRDLTYKLPAPVRGGTPAAYFSAPQYTGQVDWFVGGAAAPHSVFQSNMAYTATVTLTAAPGYTLGNPAAAFSHAGSSAITTATGAAVVVSVSFPATTGVEAQTVSDLNLSSRVPKPVRNGTPARYFSAPQYTGNVAWKRTGDNTPLEGLFEANTAYTATVTLTAASLFTLSGVAADAFTCGGALTVSNTADSGEVVITFPATSTVAATVVDALDLTAKVAAPVRGGTPVDYFSDIQYTGNVAWSVSSGGQGLSGLFEAGTAYTATVTLTAVSGYTFAGVGAYAFTHDGGAAANAANSGVVTISFPATTSVAAILVSDRDLTYKLPAPVRGGTAERSISVYQYTGTVAWSVSSGGPALSGAFGAGTAYTATVTLTAASGYTFAGVGANAFTHAGGTVTSAANSGVVVVSFPATGTVTAPAVSDLDLTGKVPAPVRGGTPVPYFSAPEYTGTVAWSTGGSLHDEVFASSTVYTATVTLSAVSPFTFTGISGHFTHDRASGITAADNGGKLTITFPATDSTQAKAVDDLDLTAKVHGPVWGGTPATYFSAPQYTGTVAWSPALTGLFASNTAYTATVTLTAASGFTLSGVGPNAFTHNGKSSIGNGAGSGEVTIVFPQTTGETAAAVSDFDLTARVPMPVNGETPESYFSAAQYTGNVAWKRTDNNAALTGVFGAGTAYTATVTLTAASGYTLSGVRANTFIHSYRSYITNPADSGVVTIDFPPTGGVPVNTTVTEKNLTAPVAAPVQGAVPASYFSAPQYTGTVAWKRTADGAALTGLFAPATAYTATVTLTAAPGFTFDGVVANSFTHDGRSSISNPADSGVVTITFPATGAAPVIEIRDVDLTLYVPAPVMSAVPVRLFNAGTYSGTAVWTDAGGAAVSQFKANTVYKATITLHPAAGYSFASPLPITLGSMSASFTGVGETRSETVTFAETGSYQTFTGPFAGSPADRNDSVVDLIRSAREAGHTSLYLTLSPRADTVSLGAGSDLDKGLTLTTTTSPADLVIDGQKRTVKVTGPGTGSLLTVGPGVTLTLRNITLMSNTLDNSALLVNVMSGGRLVLESAVLLYDLATGGTVSYAPVEGDSTRVWETHTFTQSGTLSLGAYDTVTADYLIVAGGGGAGGDNGSTTTSDFAGGGGAGGLMYKTGQTLSPGGAVPIIVGAGGAGGQKQTQGADGGASAIGSISVPGGGGGGGSNANMNGRPGGSGGGGGAGNGSAHGNGGARSSSDPDILGNRGGNGANGGGMRSDSGGGGGGAEGQGTDSPGANTSALAGGAPWDAAGGGASWIVDATGTAAFSRGGNGGGTDAPQGGRAGVNYGDGGSAGNNKQLPGGAGHDGIVVIRLQRRAVGME